MDNSNEAMEVAERFIAALNAADADAVSNVRLVINVDPLGLFRQCLVCPPEALSLLHEFLLSTLRQLHLPGWSV